MGTHEEACKKLDGEVAQLKQIGEETASELTQVQEWCHRLERAAKGKCFVPGELVLKPFFTLLSFAAILPAVPIEDAEDRLMHVVGLAQRMKVALTIAVGTFWYQDSSVGTDLEAILTCLQNCPERFSEGQYSAAFEGARMALALLKAHYPGVNLHELVRTNPTGVEPVMFFEAVKDDAKYVASACDLDNITEPGYKF